MHSDGARGSYMAQTTQQCDLAADNPVDLSRLALLQLGFLVHAILF